MVGPLCGEKHALKLHWKRREMSTNVIPKKSTLKQNTAQSQLSPAAGGAVYLCHRSRVTVVGTAQDDIAVRLYAGLFWNDTQWFSHQRDVCETTMTHTHTRVG